MLAAKVIVNSSMFNVYRVFTKSVKIFTVTQIRTIQTDFPKIPDCEYISSPYQGANYGEIKDACRKTVSPSLKPFYKEPLLMHEGHGQWLWDHKGKRYLDMFGGIATVSVGHSHPKIIEAIEKQSSKLGHTTTIYMHPRLYEYATKLAAKFPGKLKTVYLTNSGSEANELAFLMARIHTGKYNIISLRNGYHGGTCATMASTAMSNWKYPIVQPPGHVCSVYPDVYKGVWGGSKCRDSPVQVSGRNCKCTDGYCEASEKYFFDFEDVFRYALSSRNSVAAFIAESIQGVGGTVQYPKNFLKKVCDYVHQNNGLYISDEVQTGFGRTGEHFWGFEGHGVTPDIVTMAKGIGNGFPLGAVVTTTEIAESLNAALHFNTFGGNPIASAVGSTVLDIIEEENLQGNAAKVGTYLIQRLATLLSLYPDIVGDVRGKGLMIGVELVSDPETREHLQTDRMLDIFEDIKDMGLLVGSGGLRSNVLRIKPPMCVTKKDADFTFEVIHKALQTDREKHLKKNQ